MGLRGVIGFLLVISIALTFSSYMFFHLTEYDTGQKFFTPQIEQKLKEEVSPGELADMESDANADCLSSEFSYVKSANEQVKVNCSEIRAKSFSTALAEAIYDQKIFSRKYGCSFFSCLQSKETLPALFAQQFHSSYRIYYLYLIAIDIVLAILLFFVSEGWREKGESFGYVLLISGLGAIPFFVTEKLFGNGMKFFSRMLHAQLAMLITGIVLLVLTSVLTKREKTGEDMWNETGKLNKKTDNGEEEEENGKDNS